VAAVGMVEVPAHQVVDVVPVGHRFMATTGTVHVRRFVSGTHVLRRAGTWIRLGHFQPALVEMISMQRVHAAVVEIIDMCPMANRGMAAIFAVYVSMVAVDLVPGHDLPH